MSTITTTAIAASASMKARRSRAASPVFSCEPKLGEDTPVEQPAVQAPDDVICVRAPNPSPLTLDGTNTYVVGGWVVDPGPLLDDHLDSVRAAAGEVEAVVLTHGHADHAEAAEAFGVSVHRPGEGERAGPFTALATPGHSPDSVCLLMDR